ncbi:hypothetical protein BI49514_00438 [Brevibacterium iodinum ATCC 49514]|uniref:Uncharacterized protein n=1 Tax=Brevibacterium iodinum ATCC 49514 TaxID=1255616 RepID=A0A2H1HWX7_9MICO|nr:hypothetical protein [Brevibacterium iodinum]SMX67382.1 hypothetical protein BI49514_00438 [Brevibacterium iodinum ATCC 49514]SUW13722.1 Predicted acetyltransferase [Brevibacterium iodinum]
MTNPLTPQFTVRTETSGDIDAIHASGYGIEGLSFVGVLDGEAIAHAMLSRCFVGEAPGVCLAPCSVWPEHQRTAAGTPVIEALLA